MNKGFSERSISDKQIRYINAQAEHMNFLYTFLMEIKLYQVGALAACCSAYVYLCWCALITGYTKAYESRAALVDEKLSVEIMFYNFVEIP